MTHLLARGHGERFAKLMDKHMPDWKEPRTGSITHRSVISSG